jgi:hypothetical protein
MLSVISVERCSGESTPVFGVKEYAGAGIESLYEGSADDLKVENNCDGRNPIRFSFGILVGLPMGQANLYQRMHREAR